jgi:phenylacetate-coenzyme A ligase PaaK-like adenylate-forming protein
MQKWNIHKQKAYQLKKLQEFIHILSYSPYYKSLFSAYNIKPKHISSLEDIQKIPFTTKQDVVTSIEHPEKASSFVLDPSQSLSQISKLQLLFSSHLKEQLLVEFKPVHVHFTAGRSAMSIPIFSTQQDILHVHEAAKRIINYVKIPHTARFVNLFPSAPHLAFWHTVFAAQSLGVFALHTGGGKMMGTERIIENIEKMQAEAITGIPSYVYHLISLAAEQHRDFSHIQHIILGGEGITQDYISKLKHMLTFARCQNVAIYSTYAFAEGKVTWAQCHEESGYHLYPDMEYIEIVDKEGKRVADGQSGEIVYTGFGFRGTAFLRYKTGDIGRLETAPCQHCSAKTPRLDPAVIRSSEIMPMKLTKVKGSFVDFNAVSALLSSLSFIEEWQIILQKKEKFGLDEIVIHAAVAKNHTFAKNEIIRVVQATFAVTPVVVFKKKEEIVCDLNLEGLKGKRIVDTRV